MPTLRQGSTGSEVTEMQEKLRTLGFNSGPGSGTFDEATGAAVIAFQRSEGLLADGVAGPRTLAAMGLIETGNLPPVVANVTVEIVGQMFPHTPKANISTNLPFVLDALSAVNIGDKPMVLMALASIRAETESFEPISEGQSRFNTSPGGLPFDLYDNRRDLGNQGPPDGDRFKGRGFIQLTGRTNYQQHGAKIGMGNQLIDNPDLANSPEVAARLLASFLKAKELPIKAALLDNDLKTARRLVNGGSHGLDRFSDAYNIGNGLI